MAHYEPSYQDLSCLQVKIFSSLVLEELMECTFIFLYCKHLGPVVQSIVSLTSSLRGQLVKCFMTL